MRVGTFMDIHNSTAAAAGMVSELTLGCCCSAGVPLWAWAVLATSGFNQTKALPSQESHGVLYVHEIIQHPIAAACMLIELTFGGCCAGGRPLGLGCARKLSKPANAVSVSAWLRCVLATLERSAAELLILLPSPGRCCCRDQAISAIVCSVNSRRPFPCMLSTDSKLHHMEALSPERMRCAGRAKVGTAQDLQSRC